MLFPLLIFPLCCAIIMTLALREEKSLFIIYNALHSAASFDIFQSLGFGGLAESVYTSGLAPCEQNQQYTELYNSHVMPLTRDHPSPNLDTSSP
jgi:hypothetical protein